MIISAKKFRFLAIFFAVSFFVSGCSDSETKKVAHYNKGMEYVEKEDYKPAILEFKNAIQIDPKYAAARYQLGLAYLKNKQPSDAVEELIRAADLDPQNLEAQFILGQIFSIGVEKISILFLIGYVEFATDGLRVPILGEQ